MPLKNDLTIAFRDGVAELATTVVEPERDEPDAFLAAVHELLFEHQYLAMTDPAILDPEGAGLRTVLLCRDPLPEPMRAGLALMGFSPEQGDAGGREDHSLFEGLQRRRRTKLDKWIARHVRAAEASPLLGALEESLVVDVPPGRLEDVMDDAVTAMVDAERSVARTLVAPGLEGLSTLERQLGTERSKASGRLVLHPAMVRAITAFTAATIMSLDRSAAWLRQEQDLPARLVLEGRREALESDPELRVVRFVAKGMPESLTDYVRALLEERRGL